MRGRQGWGGEAWEGSEGKRERGDDVIMFYFLKIKINFIKKENFGSSALIST